MIREPDWRDSLKEYDIIKHVRNKTIRVVREAKYANYGFLYGVWVIKQKCNKYPSPYTLIDRYNLQMYEKLTVKAKADLLVEKDFKEKFFSECNFCCIKRIIDW
jgi:hypothetical protein